MMQAPKYEKGSIVGYVDITREEPRPRPVPHCWFLLIVYPGRDARVMRAFKDRGVTAYSPTFVRTICRSRPESTARKPHLGRKVVTSLFPGLIFVPDFEFYGCSTGSVDGVREFLRFGDRYATLTPKLLEEVRAIEALLNVPRGRRYKLGDSVRFADGPFADFVGKVDRLDSRGRLRVFIDTIKRGVTVIATEAQLEPV